MDRFGYLDVRTNEEFKNLVVAVVLVTAAAAVVVVVE